jgi:hypothetical protein
LDRSVGRPDIQQLIGASKDARASKCIFVATCRFTDEAVECARKNGVELIGPERLTIMIQEAFPASGSTLLVQTMCLECGDILSLPLGGTKCNWCRNGHFVVPCLIDGDLVPDPVVQSRTGRRRQCKQCGRAMRVVKWKGRKFRGCTGYPGCRGSEPYP